MSPHSQPLLELFLALAFTPHANKTIVAASVPIAIVKNAEALAGYTKEQTPLDPHYLSQASAFLR